MGRDNIATGKGITINGSEGSWGYLKRKLESKGGIRGEKLPLYFWEYIRRYNHRNDNNMIKVERILDFLE